MGLEGVMPSANPCVEGPSPFARSTPDAQAAIQKLDGSDLDGRVLSVNEGQARRVGGKRRA